MTPVKRVGNYRRPTLVTVGIVVVVVMRGAAYISARSLGAMVVDVVTVVVVVVVVVRPYRFR